MSSFVLDHAYHAAAMGAWSVMHLSRAEPRAAIPLSVSICSIAASTMDEIPNDQLRLADIPADDADLDDLIRFAHTFNGYDAFGGFHACADIANAGDHSSLSHLRACLFFEARRWRHFGDDPSPESLAYWHELVGKIRACVEECGG